MEKSKKGGRQTEMKGRTTGNRERKQQKRSKKGGGGGGGGGGGEEGEEEGGGGGGELRGRIKVGEKKQQKQLASSTSLFPLTSPLFGQHTYLIVLDQGFQCQNTIPFQHGSLENSSDVK